MAKTSDLAAKRKKMKEAPAAKAKASSVLSPADPKKKKKSRAEEPPAVTVKAGKKSVALAVSGKHGALALPDASRNIDRNDLIMPKLMISQALSEVNVTNIVQMGNWYNTIRKNSLGKTVYVVPVDMRKSRSVYKQGAGVICRSFDLVQGEGDPGILCEGTPREMKTLRESDRGCELRLWETDEKTGRRIPPQCQLAYNFPVLLIADPKDLENTKVRRAMLTFRKTASKAATNIISIVQDDDEPVWFNHIFKLTLELKKFDNGGSAYIPTVAYAGETNERIRERAKLFAAIVSDQFIRANLETDDTAE